MAELLWVLAGLAALLAATGLLCQRLRLPPALGYLVVGIALPAALPGLGALVQVDLLRDASHVAVLVLLYFIGMELDVRTLRRILAETRVVSVFDLLVPALVVASLARLWGWTLLQSIVLGLSLGLSSTIFGDRLSAGSRFPPAARHRIFGVLLAEDIVAGGILAVLAVLAGGVANGGWIAPLQTVGVLLVGMAVLAAVALLLVPRLLDRIATTHMPELVVVGALAMLLVFAAAGDWVGSAELGAFLAGMAAAEAGSRFVVRNALSGLRHIALAVFFFAAGVVVDPRLVLEQGPFVLLCILAVAAAKLAVHVPGGLAAGLGLADATRVGAALATVGEFGLILVAAAQAGGLAHDALGATVAGTIVGLLLLAPVLMRAANVPARLVQRLPARLRTSLEGGVQSMRRLRRKGTHGAARPAAGEGSVARAIATVLLLAFLGAAAAFLHQEVLARFPGVDALWAAVATYGVALALATPLLVRAHARYRSFLQAFFQVRGDTAVVSATARFGMRLVDALLLLTAALIAVLVALLMSASWEVVAATAAVAVAIAAFAGRQMARMTGALETSLARVLGADEQAQAVLLGESLAQYGWGVEAAAVAIGPHSRFVGKSLADTRLEASTGVTVAVLKRRGHESVNPDGTEKLREADTLVLVGEPQQIRRAEALLDEGEGILRLAAETRAAVVTEITVETPFLGPRPHLEPASGTRILGYVPTGQPSPRPWHPGLVPQPGDRLIVLGSPLQVERLRAAMRESAPDAPSQS
ncbi:MAG: monovalent cation:H+ antiporter-2, family [Thermoplasmata archaeon]|jgi:CPA2 family monovalent cation:H+ antiporter-2|nr:monovalent cation:H+ antiporter-2, family [Thermoplasmata archaeon]